MDLLDSIMSNMAKPPVINSRQKEMMKEQQKAMEEAKMKEKELLNQFRKTIEERMITFVENEAELKKSFEPMDVVARSVVRDIADVAGLTAYVFGADEEERYVMVFKKEYHLADDEINALRKGDDYDPVRAKQEALQKILQLKEDEERAQKLRKEPSSLKFKEKYERIAGKDETIPLEAENRQFGFVPSELKKDKRTIEQTLADIKAKRLKKAEQNKTS